MKGTAVCHKHGGKAPQTLRKAQERIAHASDIAVLQILALMQARDTPAPVKLAAARDLLDRANVTGKTTVEIEVPAWQQLLDGIVATLPMEGDAAMRPFAEAQPAPDPLVVEAERVDQERELERYQSEPHDADWSDDFAHGSDGPPAPRPTTKAPEPVAEVRPPIRANGDDRPPRPRPERDAEAERRRREPEFADDVDHLPPASGPTNRSGAVRRGRVAGRRR